MTWRLRSNLWLLAVTRHWLRGVIVFWLVFGSLPWLAPVLMKLGATGPANAIYQFYTPMCHRFPFRSFFLFGEQAAYPLAVADTDLASFESYAGKSPTVAQIRARRLPLPPFGLHSLPELAGATINGQYVPLNIPENLAPSTPQEAVNFARVQLASSGFIGNAEMGYKTAVCERDVSIYAGLGFGALIFAIPAVRRKLRPLPLWMFLFVGLVPIGLDGFSQLLSYEPFGWWPMRETTPVFRVATGLMFGLATAWLGYPNIELSMQDTQYALEAKLAEAGYAAADRDA